MYAIESQISVHFRCRFIYHVYNEQGNSFENVTETALVSVIESEPLFNFRTAIQQIYTLIMLMGTSKRILIRVSVNIQFGRSALHRRTEIIFK